jgi:hypothetical protein
MSDWGPCHTLWSAVADSSTVLGLPTTLDTCRQSDAVQCLSRLVLSVREDIKLLNGTAEDDVCQAAWPETIICSPSDLYNLYSQGEEEEEEEALYSSFPVIQAAMHQQDYAVCGFVPSYILEAIVSSGTAPEESKLACKATLEHKHKCDTHLHDASSVPQVRSSHDGP